ncbi:hypothetical protein CAY95_33370 [Pseudomonas aeruginosa]|nr:hypothetical protein CAY95_33370 [Pseudomonas aeruginosa]
MRIVFCKQTTASELLRRLVGSITLGATSRNWLARPEFHYSPLPRERHGKSGVARAKRKARKYKRRNHGRP